MYKCIDCGYEFEAPARWSENRGEYWGVSCCEEMDGCPECHGDYEEIYPCEICESHYPDEELISGICEKCIDEYRNNFDVCYEISRGHTETIQINSLISTLFDASEIESILKLHIKENCPDVDCSSFIDADISWFAEQLSKEVKK